MKNPNAQNINRTIAHLRQTYKPDQPVIIDTQTGEYIITKEPVETYLATKKSHPDHDYMITTVGSEMYNLL